MLTPDYGPFEFECDRCGHGSGMLGHLRSDGTWACTLPALPEWQDAIDSLFAPLEAVWDEPYADLELYFGPTASVIEIPPL